MNPDESKVELWLRRFLFQPKLQHWIRQSGGRFKWSSDHTYYYPYIIGLWTKFVYLGLPPPDKQI